MGQIFQYYVEGQCEQKMIDTMKLPGTKTIKPGKVSVFNVVQNRFTDLHLRQLKNGTIVILVFDTDKGDSDILESNIKYLRQYRTIKDVWLIPEVTNFEEELLYSTNIKSVKELIPSRSTAEFKGDFCKEKNLTKKLEQHSFDSRRFWSRRAKGTAFCDLKNDHDMVFV